MYKRFHYDRLRNDGALGNGKSDNNKNNVDSAWDPFRPTGPEMYNAHL